MNTKESQRLAEIEKAIVLSIKDREQMKEDLKEIKQDMKVFQVEFKEFTNSLDDKYAKKSSVDKLRHIVWLVIGAGFAGLWGALIKLLIK